MDDWRQIPERVAALVADPAEARAADLAGDPAGKIAVAALTLRPATFDHNIADFRGGHARVWSKLAARSNGAGGLGVRSIPVDAFNKAVWNDVARGPNPWGTRNPLGDNEAPMHTPPPVAAAVSGIVAGAGAASRSSHVSPLQVAAVAGETAGKGWLAGLALGKTLGVLSGLSPTSQRHLQDAGLWGGLLVGATRGLFGGR